MKTALFILFASSTFNLISALAPQPRFGQGCVSLKQKIYCYGGGRFVAGATNYNTVYNDHLVLDLSKDFAVNDAQNAWNNLPAPSNFTLEPNYKFAFAPISNTSYLVTSGSGYNDNKTPLKNKTTLYHADKDEWESIPTTANQSIGITLDVDNNGKGYVFGGIITYTNIVPNRNLLTLTLSSKQWSTLPLGPGTTLRTDHASAMDKNGIIYYTGGRIGSPSGGVYSWNTNVPLTSITTYDTKAQTWGSVAVSGANPTLRNSHTFTYLPKDNKFVLFGGKQGLSETPGSFDDICYTFDPAEKTWTRQNVTTIGSGSRFGHSAVLYNNVYLFIIFGADEVTMSMNDFHVLNVQNWSWVTQFSANGLPDANGNGNGNGNNSSTGGKNSDDPTPISGGAIAGIVIGVVAAIGIAAGAFFFLRRRRNNNNNTTTNGNNNVNNNQNLAAERKPRDDFEVDQEFEVPPAPRYFSTTAQNFINAGNNKTNLGQSPLDQQQPQDNRVYHPDEMSTSTAPTYTSGTPIMVSPVATTVVGSDNGVRQNQYKPDLTMDPATEHSFDQEPVKPHGLH
ncbi:hypothetical protein BCR42DRAFT_489243 [Absidia repens]|uniref:Galactose oxidase n=1 Tax=Absidia repens TaxID=90262 RepID=A0A1X2IR65_9FUNG|nr:hypothetical protein BCR42DRAFT_489243 [Absidia repens]